MRTSGCLGTGEYSRAPLYRLAPAKMLNPFSRKVQKEVKKAWPSELNPCPKYMNGAHSVSPLWDVQGKVTKVCVGCVGELEKALQTRGITEARLSALWWFFTPNPHGADVKYGAPFSEKPLLGDRPTWADERFKQSVLSPLSTSSIPQNSDEAR